jgi:hypothetical protein
MELEQCWPRRFARLAIDTEYFAPPSPRSFDTTTVRPNSVRTQYSLLLSFDRSPDITLVVLRCLVVLPTQLRDRLVADLDKRLDLDIDELLESPKLRLQLSPAELDKSLLELYDTVSKSPGGDLLRLIAGGGQIGLQNLYMRRRTQKNVYQQGVFAEFFPSPLDDDSDRDDPTRRTPVQRIRWALRKNTPNGGGGNLNGTAAGQGSPASTVAPGETSPQSSRKGQGMKMTMRPGASIGSESKSARALVCGRSSGLSAWSGLRPCTGMPAFRKPPLRKPLSLSLLI